MPDLSSLSLVSFAFIIVMPVISGVMLIVCWIWGDVSWIVKAIFTVVFAASFGLLFTRAPQLFTVAQALLAFALGFATFFTFWIPPSKGRGRGIVRY